MAVIQKQNLRKQIKAHLLDQIYRNKLSPDQRLTEMDLSSRLEVSRTPLREALIELEMESFLISVPRKGFLVRRYSEKEGRELYTLIALLETWALDLAGPLDAQKLEGLARFNLKLEQENDLIAIIEGDVQWHALLLEHCPNEMVKTLIESMKKKLTLFEHAFFRRDGRIQSSAKDHEAILSALRAEDLGKAKKILEAHWLAGIQQFDKPIDIVVDESMA